MVFAVTGRGKTKGERSDTIEVGSWVIGYWRPELHFEVNVWHCFERRVRKLLAALAVDDPLVATTFGSSIADVLENKAQAFVACIDARSAIEEIPDGVVDLIVTDPPHSDRLPYLELSELWNSLLGSSPDFEREIVVSNAKERSKSPKVYTAALRACLVHFPRVLSRTGCLVCLFNARQREAWDVLRIFYETTTSKNFPHLNYLGQFPCEYSARSVVQDNREGALKHDIAIVFGRSTAAPGLSALSGIPGWSTSLPRHLAEQVTNEI